MRFELTKHARAELEDLRQELHRREKCYDKRVHKKKGSASCACAMANEASIETPRGKGKRANTDVATPAASKRRLSRKDQAQSLFAEAEHLEKMASELAKEASAAEQAAVEALHRATSLRETADAKAREAAAAKTVAAEGRHRADRAELETTKEGRDALKAGKQL